VRTGQFLRELDDEAVGVVGVVRVLVAAIVVGCGQVARPPGGRAADLDVLGGVGEDHFDHALGLFERRLDGVGDARAALLADLHAVDDDVDSVVVVLVQFRPVHREVVLLAVDLDAGVAVTDEVVEQVFEGALLVTNDRGGDLRPGSLGSSSIRRTMFWALWVPTSRPHSGQWGVPTRAYSRRR